MLTRVTGQLIQDATIFSADIAENQITLDHLNIDAGAYISGYTLGIDGSGDFVYLPPGSVDLAGLSDVDLTGAVSGEVLGFDGSEWAPTSLVPAAMGLDDLTDVSVSGAAIDEVLLHDGVEFVNSLLNISNISDVDTSGAINNDLLTFNGTIWVPLANQAEANTGTNLGAGSGFYTGKVSEVFQFRSIRSTTPNIVISNTATEINITTNGFSTVALSGDYDDLLNTPTLVSNLADLADVDAGSPGVNDVLKWNGSNWIPDTFVGEINTGSNVGGGNEVFLQKSGVDFEFRTLIAGSNITIVENANDLTITANAIPTAFDDLTDVAAGSPTVGDIVKFVGGNWTNSTLVASELTDVDTAGSVLGNFLRFDGSEWIAGDFSNDVSLNNLSNVLVPSPTVGQYLTWSGANWVNGTIAAVQVSGLSTVALSNDYDDLDNLPSLSTVALSNDYNDLDNLPSIPGNGSFTFTGLSDTTPGAVANGILIWNGSGTLVSYVTQISAATQVTGLSTVALSNDYTDLDNLPSLSTVALSNDYDDLDNLPSIPVNSDFDLTGLSDTAGVAVANGILIWNGAGTTVGYQTQISAATQISGLGTVATSNDYGDLDNLPSLSTVATTGDYTDLINLPSIPINSDFALTGLSDTAGATVNNGILVWNGTGTSVVYVTQISAATQISGLNTVATSGDYNDLSNTPVLATVATTGNYSDLIGTPSVPVNNDFSFTGLNDTANTPLANGILVWNGAGTSVVFVNQLSAATQISGLANVATSGDYNDLANLPTLATVSATGDYSDLINKPSIPTNNNFSLTGLNDTTGSALANGILIWNGAGNNVNYVLQLSAATQVSGLANVATSGDYNDLANLPSVPSDLTDLDDVTIVGPLVNNYLCYNGSEWIDAQIDYSHIANTPSAGALDDLSDVDTTGAGVDDVLTYNGVDWIADSLGAIVGTATTLTLVTAPTILPANNDIAVVGVRTNDAGWSDSDTISLPAAPNNKQRIFIKDVDGNAATKSIVVSGNGNLIDGMASQVLQLNWAGLSLIYNATVGWIVI